jgi:hypothetical protein
MSLPLIQNVIQIALFGWRNERLLRACYEIGSRESTDRRICAYEPFRAKRCKKDSGLIRSLAASSPISRCYRAPSYSYCCRT